MLQQSDVRTWRGCDAVDREGQKIGRLEEVYYDAQGGTAQWAAVKTGLLGSNLSVVPLAGAEAVDDHVRIPMDERAVKDAPSFKDVRRLSPEEESKLYSYYGMQQPTAGISGAIPYGEMAEREGQAQRPHDGTGHEAHAADRHEEGTPGTDPGQERGTRVRRQVTTEYLSESGEVERRETHTEEERPGRIDR